MVAWIVAVLVGLSVVMQGGLNRQVSTHVGLAWAVFINSVVFIVAGIGLLFWARHLGEGAPSFVKVRGGLSDFSWWFVLPGLFGFIIVTGVPFAISRIGALKVFLISIVIQVIVSLFWDASVEGFELSPYRITGALLALAGTVLIGLKG